MIGLPALIVLAAPATPQATTPQATAPQAAQRATESASTLSLGEAIELAIAALKDDLENEKSTAEKIKSGIQNVTEAAMKLGEAIYKAQQDGADDEPQAADMGGDSGGNDDDIVDAEFEDLDDDKRA